ncbi:MAG: hypothetical protein A3G32_07220 [Deltaproteobacteria bacterium RIFCSPLOWO2_12_FULL_40_28]|nr:MAG: hypothetical protein A3C45_07265 [Deltaproteobacteria bacterium RIFCSPHIGHO2_02_FULL_40_28]OGQ19254.1 MAG: hypothetical protein A3E27_04550 [Deltaproteobacteria bacterium RIFCSPHIGHO2_12_FULL_40_32]OGQ40523.1 MAG: hypothetical protein A3I69_00520 [Deltaproteobacteria bacterium RIFCSPLOWO2_02_FULL_40_36]OGQ53758.1 MAG: hypothetical protein A3G32_07220 [Deltaproteobacteria bacterium RIFCSPLOWO2_12_FULL_40_28]OGX39424.1 MAG: hypothetical protein A2984_03225 [Omnitrophica WOR_2 bacterium RI
MMIKKISVIIFIFCFFLSACGGLTTVGNPRGKPVEASLTNDVDNPVSEALHAVTVQSGADCRLGSGSCYTPPLYIFGMRSLGLVRCVDVAGDDEACPGQTGEELEENALTINEDFFVSSLNETVTDFILYSDPSEASALLGSNSGTVTGEITQGGIYSGLEFALDFVVTQLPSDIFSIDATFAFYCLNSEGCSSLNGYSSFYDGLSEGEVSGGDIVFLDELGANWFYWDFDADALVPLSTEKPTNVLSQSLPDWEDTSTGALVYHPSFGSVTPLTISVTSEETAFLRLIFAVENAMAFQDANSNSQVDASEIENLEFGKPFIIDGGISITDPT